MKRITRWVLFQFNSQRNFQLPILLSMNEFFIIIIIFGLPILLSMNDYYYYYYYFKVLGFLIIFKKIYNNFKFLKKNWLCFNYYFLWMGSHPGLFFIIIF